MAFPYTHSITLKPETSLVAKIHLDVGDVIEVHAYSIDGSSFWIKIYNSCEDKFFLASRGSILDMSYTVPAPGEYTIKIENDADFRDITVDYTITAITGFQYIKFPGSKCWIEEKDGR